jgi:hypothetical protein
MHITSGKEVYYTCNMNANVVGTVSMSILLFWCTPQITNHISFANEGYYTCNLNANLVGTMTVSILLFWCTPQITDHITIFK